MAFNNGSAITADGDYDHTPVATNKAHDYLFVLPVSAGTATITLKQDGVAFDGLNALAVTTAGVRKVVTVDSMATVTFTVASAASLSCTPRLRPIGFQE